MNYIQFKEKKKQYKSLPFIQHFQKFPESKQSKIMQNCPITNGL